MSEGFGRATHGEFGNRLSVAVGELRETENHLLDALECKYVDAPEYTRLTTLAQRSASTAIGLYIYLIRTPDYRMYDPRT